MKKEIEVIFLDHKIYMSLFFITGSKGKLAEVQAFLPEVQQLELDLPEIQHIDSHEIIKAKLKVGLEQAEGEIMVEDTSLYLDCLNGLPGPLIKWFLKTVKEEGLYRIAQGLNNFGAEAKVVIGYAKNDAEPQFFEGSVRGKIVAPRGTNGFAWDIVFQPEGYDKTFAEMTLEEKNTISMRKIAVLKLKEHLEKIS